MSLFSGFRSEWVAFRKCTLHGIWKSNRRCLIRPTTEPVAQKKPGNAPVYVQCCSTARYASLQRLELCWYQNCSSLVRQNRQVYREIKADRIQTSLSWPDQNGLFTKNSFWSPFRDLHDDLYEMVTSNLCRPDPQAEFCRISLPRLLKVGRNLVEKNV